MAPQYPADLSVAVSVSELLLCPQAPLFLLPTLGAAFLTHLMVCCLPGPLQDMAASHLTSPHCLPSHSVASFSLSHLQFLQTHFSPCGRLNPKLIQVGRIGVLLSVQHGLAQLGVSFRILLGLQVVQMAQGLPVAAAHTLTCFQVTFGLTESALISHCLLHADKKTPVCAQGVMPTVFSCSWLNLGMWSSGARRQLPL